MINMKSTISLLITLNFLLQVSNSYLQFKLFRNPTQSKQIKQQNFACPQSIETLSQVDYKEVCYDKDISYSFQIFHEGHYYYISADFTTPISWIKGKQCTLQLPRIQALPSNQGLSTAKSSSQVKKCSFIQDDLKIAINQYTQIIKKKLKRHKNTNSQQETRQKAQIQGSSNLIKGYLEKPTHLSFQIMDSNRLTRLIDILLLGFFVLGQTDTVQLQSTQFINASYLNPKLNQVSDGGISLRFDQNSQNSFLNEIFAYTKSDQKIATVYVGQNNWLTLGELSLKFSEYGYSGIQWVKVQQDQYFGKIPKLTQIVIQEPQKQIAKKITVNKPVVLTLSASYIGMHQEMVQVLTTKLSKSASCAFQQHHYLRCNYTRKTDKDRDLNKKLTFAFDQISISLDLKDIVMHDESKSVILNIKQLLQNDYLVLGEPIFKKYTIYLDYSNQKIGFTIKRQHFQKQFINVVSLIRFLVLVFSCGCCFILCSAPCRVIWNRIVSRQIGPKIIGKQKLRLKQYSPIQQEQQFQQISEKIKSITTSRETTQVDGHPDDSI